MTNAATFAKRGIKENSVIRFDYGKQKMRYEGIVKEASVSVSKYQTHYILFTNTNGEEQKIYISLDGYPSYYRIYDVFVVSEAARMNRPIKKKQSSVTVESTLDNYIHNIKVYLDNIKELIRKHNT